MRHRLLTDTCAALKLAAFGEALFKPNSLPRGDLILHPLVFSETKKWHPTKKLQFEPEFKVLSLVRSTPGLVTDKKKVQAQVVIIDMTQQNLGTSIGRVDKELLAAILIDGEMGLVSNDAAFCEVASDGFGLEVVTAEEILLEAMDANLITLAAAQEAVKRWEQTNSSTLAEFVRIFREKKIL
jgi:hypothetical protein